MFASMGNKADISGNDLLEYWEDNDDDPGDPDVPGVFRSNRAEVHANWPAGSRARNRSSPSRRAAPPPVLVPRRPTPGRSSGRDIATESLLEQCGVLRVLDPGGDVRAGRPRWPTSRFPRGNRIAHGHQCRRPGDPLCTDACIGRGHANLPNCHRRRREASDWPTRAALAREASVVQSGGHDRLGRRRARYRKPCWRSIKKDPAVDGIIAIFVSPIMIDAYEVARAIADAADGSKPILSVFMGKQRSREGLAGAAQASSSVYRFPDQAASAMTAMCAVSRSCATPRRASEELALQGQPAAVASRVINGAFARRERTELNPEEVRKRVLLLPTAFRLRPPANVVSESARQLSPPRRSWVIPVVLKIASDRKSRTRPTSAVCKARPAQRRRGRLGVSPDLTSRLGRRDSDLKVQVQSS